MDKQNNAAQGELTKKQNLQILSLDVCNFSQLTLMLGFAHGLSFSEVCVTVLVNIYNICMFFSMGV